MIGPDLLFSRSFQFQSVVEWHFDLEPRSDDMGALVDRARDLRSRTEKPTDQPMSTVRVDADGRVEGPAEGNDAAVE